MHKIRCKMRMEHKIVTETSNGKQTDVKFCPVYSDVDGSENKKYWNYTPSGVLEFQCVNEAAMAHLEPGKEYYVDIITATDEEDHQE